MQPIDLNALPILLSVPNAVLVSGLSRSELYRRLASGELKGRKMRRSTLVETISLIEMLSSLPTYND